MKNALIFAIGFASTAALVSAHAQTYQWKDGSGRTVISDTPPPGSAARNARTLGGKPPTSSEFKTEEAVKADIEKSMAEKEMAFQKRQKEAKEKAEKQAKEQAAAREKQEVCERTRRNLATLESNQAITTADEQGGRQAMSDEQRQQEIERARKIMNDACGT